MQITIEKIIKALTIKGYAIFEQDDKNYNLNIVGIRSQENKVNAFDDIITTFWKYKGLWNLLQFHCTTDPGLYWLTSPGNPLGTAILKEGQYRGMWQVGKHKEQYEALVQRKPCVLIRDFDRDKELDFNGTEDEGLFGINCHRANAKQESTQIDKWSAGCQVFANPDDFHIFMTICGEAVENWGNSFTYTLINENNI